MRWTDKPRKKTRREFILEYIKFIKTMGLYPNLVAYMYKYSTYGGYLSLDERIYELKVICHKQYMIRYLVNILKIQCNKIPYWYTIETYLFRYPFAMPPKEARDITSLFFSYLKDKHMDNCIFID